MGKEIFMTNNTNPTNSNNQFNSTGDEDTVYLNAFLAGDDDAFTYIYNKYADDLFAFGMGFGFDRETLKDVIQDVFYKLYFDKKKLKKVVRLKYYLFAAFKNKLFDLYRSSVETTTITEEMPFSVKSTILDHIIGEEEQTAIQEYIDSLLNKVTDRQRTAIYLRFIEEMEYEEVAKLLDMTPPAVRKLVHRAIKRMRE